MFFIRLAMANVFRHTGRTLLSTVSIVAGVMVIIFGRAFVQGTKENIIRAQIDTYCAHAMIIPADYPTNGVNHPIDHLLKPDPALEAWLKSEGVHFTRRLVFTPQIMRGQDSMRVRVFGFDPQNDAAIFPHEGWKVEGHFPTTRADGVLISRGIAQLFELQPGMTLIMSSRTVAGAINALEIPVSGVVSSGNPMIDSIGIYMPLELASDLLGSSDTYSHLALLLSNRRQIEDFVPRLKPHLPADAMVRTWKEETQGLVDAQDMRQFMLDVVALALVAIAATGIANTILMAAYERVREIGTLRAMGMTRRGVVALMMGEGLLIGVLGATLGAILGGGLSYHYSIKGIDFSALIQKNASMGSYNNVAITGMFYTEFNPTIIVGAAVFGVLLAVVASIYPALLASRLQPADAVRADG